MLTFVKPISLHMRSRGPINFVRSQLTSSVKIFFNFFFIIIQRHVLSDYLGVKASSYGTEVYHKKSTSGPRGILFENRQKNRPLWYLENCQVDEAFFSFLKTWK
jgi:hypothetical protein